MRPDLRANDALRPVSIERHFTKHAEGAVLITLGDTKVVCTATIEDKLPPWRKDAGSGWVTAEYGMLPRSVSSRVPRDAVKKGRAMEISRLIGRSLRCVTDLDALGEHQITLDCDVLQADGGTRTAAITGAYVALHDAAQKLVDSGTLPHLPLFGQCAAVSVGIIEGEPRLDLCYEEDSTADVDMNIVMQSDGHFIEVQGCAEGEAFPRSLFDAMLDLGEKGIRELFCIQQESLKGA